MRVMHRCPHPNTSRNFKFGSYSFQDEPKLGTAETGVDYTTEAVKDWGSDGLGGLEV